MKKGFILAVLTIFFSFNIAKAQNVTETPDLEFVMQLRVKISSPYSVGKIPQGDRIVIPITGGEFSGPNIKGEVLSGGADYQLGNGNRTTLEAIYSIKTDDGVYIHVRNRGIIYTGKDAFYFKAAPKFEAPTDSRYDWLNNAIFVCQPSKEVLQGGIVLNVWKVK